MRFPDKILTTISRYSGVQISVEAKFDDEWRYLALGYNDGLEVQYSHATEDDVSDTLRRMAASAGEDPVRYAASNWSTGNFRTVIDTR